jgi:hypothetical protein
MGSGTESTLRISAAEVMVVVVVVVVVVVIYNKAASK